jgi:curved DNA-binding protein CbpA
MSLPVYLRVLGISFNASPREIEKAYRKLAKKPVLPGMMQSS